MANMLVSVDGFSCTLMSLVFESWSMYLFLQGSNFTFLCVFGYFLLPIGILFCLVFFFNFYLTVSLLDD